jgi:lysine-specific demethylase 8
MCIAELPDQLQAIEPARLENLLLSCESIIDLANEEMLAIPYKDVPASWRRLLTDASLLKAICQILVVHAPNAPDTADQVLRQICNRLDTAIVVAGAPGYNRRAMMDAILDLAQEQLLERNQKIRLEIDETSRKRRRIMKEDATSSNLQYPVKTCDNAPSFMEFSDCVNAANANPFILEGTIDHWPAMNEHPWSSMSYLLSVAGERLVPVEFGSQYTDASWSQRMMPFREFVETYIEKLEGGDANVAYLAQHDLFHQIPRLEQDIVIPDYCYVSPKLTQHYERQPSDVITNAWFGPTGTISPLHHDPYHNLLAQVVGSKYIRLYSPDQSARLYPLAGMMSNTSQVQVENVDKNRFPDFKNANYVECVLKAGQVLYIPVSENVWKCGLFQ